MYCMVTKHVYTSRIFFALKEGNNQYGTQLEQGERNPGSDFIFFSIEAYLGDS